MFFKLLNLAGIDINAKIAELRADFELKARRVSERALFKARNLALIAGLFLGASIFLLLALVVGLVALFHWAEFHYGPYTGLALVASALLILAALCAGIALSYIHSDTGEPLLTSAAFASPTRQTQSAPSVGATGTTESAASASPYPAAPIKGEDLVEPLLVLLGPYLRWPVTSHPAIDSFLGQIATKAEGTTSEAVGRAADLIRNGNRATMWSILGAATLVGWLIAHGAGPPHSEHRQA
jgi:hypothetical protein